MPSSRQEVYAAIDTERDYQDGAGPGRHDPIHSFSQAESFYLIEEYIHRARVSWVDDPREHVHECQHVLRKIAAICVRTMEKYGAPSRTFITPANDDHPAFSTTIHSNHVQAADMLENNESPKDVAEILNQKSDEFLCKDVFIDTYLKPGILKFMKKYEGQNIPEDEHFKKFKLHISSDIENSLQECFRDPNNISTNISDQIRKQGIRSFDTLFGYKVIWDAKETGLFE